MRKYRFTGAALIDSVLLLFVFFFAQSAAAQGGIAFSLDNLDVTSEGVTFDVVASAGESAARLGDTQVYIAYNAATFGSKVGAGGRISAVLGESAAATGRYGAPIINDNTDERVSLTAEFLGALDEGVSLADGPVVLLHVTLQPVSGDEQGRISFYEPLMEGQQYTSDLTTAFTGVSVDGSLVADVTSLLSPTLLATAAGGGAVQLDWTSAGDAVGFEVEHAKGDGEAFRQVASLEKGSERLLHRVEGLELGTHRFRVRQVDAAGTVTYSETVEVTVEMAEEFLLDPVYPNPFNPQATVRFAVREAEAVRVELYNALGQRLRVLYDDTPQAGAYQEVTLDGSDLAGGVYFVRLQGASFAATQRVMLVK